MKKEVELNKAKWLIEPGCVVMVTSGTMDSTRAFEEVLTKYLGRIATLALRR